METVLRSAAVYLFILIVFRVAGKRSLSQITTFDLVLLLIISETTQQALIGRDFSVVNAAVAIATLITMEIVLSWAQSRVPALDNLFDSTPVVVVEHGRVLEKQARKEGVTLSDILEAGRESHGLARLDQFKYAILERHGRISVIPEDK